MPLLACALGGISWFAGLSLCCVLFSPPPLAGVRLGSWFFGVLLPFRVCFESCSEVKGIGKLLGSIMKVRFWLLGWWLFGLGIGWWCRKGLMRAGVCCGAMELDGFV